MCKELKLDSRSNFALQSPTKPTHPLFFSAPPFLDLILIVVESVPLAPPNVHFPSSFWIQGSFLLPELVMIISAQQIHGHLQLDIIKQLDKAL